MDDGIAREEDSLAEGRSLTEMFDGKMADRPAPVAVSQPRRVSEKQMEEAQTALRRMGANDATIAVFSDESLLSAELYRDRVRGLQPEDRQNLHQVLHRAAVMALAVGDLVMISLLGQRHVLVVEVQQELNEEFDEGQPLDGEEERPW